MHTRIPSARATLLRAAPALVCASNTSANLATPIKTGGSGLVSTALNAASPDASRGAGILARLARSPLAAAKRDWCHAQ